jgi:hypothetical protein
LPPRSAAAIVTASATARKLEVEAMSSGIWIERERRTIGCAFFWCGREERVVHGNL